MGRISRHGVVIPSLPKELIRNLAQQFSSKPITKDVLPSLEKATDEFFRNISYRLPLFLLILVPTCQRLHVMREEKLLKKVMCKCFSNGPSTIFRNANDRQRLVKGGGAKMSVFSVAQRYLPGELLGRVRMVKPVKRKGRARRVRETEDGGDA